MDRAVNLLDLLKKKTIRAFPQVIMGISYGRVKKKKNDSKKNSDDTVY